jgi:hypothetical protein
LIDGMVTLVPGRLHRLGGMIELDGRLHVYPPSLRGHAPSNCYLLETTSGGLLVDTGFPAYERQLLVQLKSLMGNDSKLSLMALRAADYSSLGNGAAIVTNLAVRRFYWSLLAHHLIGFPVAVEPPPVDADSSFVDDRVEWARCDVGTLIDADPDHPGTDTVEVVGAPLRKVGSARWLYDARTRTLFTSDSFCHAVCRTSSDVPVVYDANEVPERDDVKAVLLASFAWLPGATREPRDMIAQVFSSHAIERIAPAHGCVLEGEEVVAAHLKVMLEVLESFR